MLQEMTYLKVIGILLVVSGHVGGVFNLIGIPWFNNSEIFPAYSFHMPLFFFISGYFYKTMNERNILKLFKKRFNSLVIPYYKSNLFYGILVSVLIYLNIFNKGEVINFENFFITPWISGYQYNLNGPAWFVLCLFLTQITYTLFRKMIFRFINRDLIYTEVITSFLLTSLGVFSIYASVKYNVLDYDLVYVLTRVFFSMIFFNFGFVYNKYVFKYITLNIKTFMSLIILKVLFIYIFDNYTFSMRALVFRDHFIQPIVTSLFGIVYSLHISQFMNKIIIKLNLYKLDTLLSYIGNNTWHIMMHHMLCNFIIFNTYNNLLPNVNTFIDSLFMYFVLPVLCIFIPLMVPLYFNLHIDKFSSYICRTLKFKNTLNKQNV